MRRTALRPAPAALALLLLPLLAGCLGSGGPAGVPPPGPDGFAATVRWTSFGIPHVVAHDWRSLGYGHGYAFARDHLCTFAEEVVTVKGERSLWWPGESHRIVANGVTLDNAASDAFFRFVHASPDRYPSPLDGARAEVRDAAAGFAAGYNRWLADHGAPAACAGQGWVRPITLEDMARRAQKLQLLASSLAFAPGIVAAAPPLPGLPARAPPALPLPTPEGLGLGSNALALGSEATASGRGMLLGNPHFPWRGAERFHQVHLTIPGRVDVMGAALLGVPLVLIGFNAHVAWSHTVSTSWRFTLHELALVPGQPTSYLVDGAVEDMEPREVRVPLAGGGEEARTLWLTRYGPVVEMALVNPGGALQAALPAGPFGLSWDPHRAFALRDANAMNGRLVDQFYRFNTASSYEDLKASLFEVHGIPWVNTVAASPDGRAFYGDVGVVPNLDNAKLEACTTALGKATLAAARLPILDGSRAACDWTVDPAARQEGILPADALPWVERADWVENSNDSHWLPNPASPLEGYSLMVGDERRERSGRTRMGLTLAEERLGGGARCDLDPGVRCDAFTLARLQDAWGSARVFYAEREGARVVEGACTPPLGVTRDGRAVDLAEACQALREWDGRADAGSRGMALFEMFWTRAPRAWRVPFDAADPVATPRDYVGEDPRVRQALAEAVVLLQEAGLAPGASATEARAVVRDGARLPIPGGLHATGSFRMLIMPWEDGRGFQEPVHGDSYVQTVTWDDAGPMAEAILSYSQSSDPASPHFADQTRLLSRKGWVRLPFHEADILADPALQVVALRG